MKNAKLGDKQELKQFKAELCEELHQHGPIHKITAKLVSFIDELLIRLFHTQDLHLADKLSLIAMGSYGRRELQLYSDVDLLILINDQTTATELLNAGNFIQSCWDVGLEISHQITTVNDCANLASKDLSVISSLMDMRLICGRSSLMDELIYQIHPLHMWPSHDYFLAKQEEQLRRYAKYGETAYNLEPNVKNGPGGLRDIQILLSISKRQFNIKKLADGLYTSFINEKEYEELVDCQHFLWRVRFALHYLAEKKEDRLLFDYQVKLAKFFGYEDLPHSLAIEQFMKSYFKIIKRIRELNEMLIQWFSEVIVHHEKQRLTSLDDEFQLANFYIEAKNTKIFRQRPQALLTLFLWMAKRSDIQGIKASTIRLIHQSLYLINRKFRTSPASTKIFMAIMKSEPQLFEALQAMSRHGVLPRYLDCFADVTGQMQYDLFHAYTVDQHTLFVIRNIARFKNKEFQAQFPRAYEIIFTIKQPEILFLSALFHDIAKGRGGDHSELGAQEASQFAKRHHLKPEETDLLIWLVRHHLLMSITAQRKDIYDPRTIADFCHQLPKREVLDYLYLLTVADICATNPNLWNAWKDSLLKELYHATEQAFQREQAMLDENSLINIRKQMALSLLNNEGYKAGTIEKLWSNFKGKYFLHESPEIIAGHTKAILDSKSFPVIMIMPHYTLGGTEVFIYMPHKDERFIITTTLLNNFNLTIQEASITTCDNHFDLDTYIVLDDKNQVVINKELTETIANDLAIHLNAAPIKMPHITKRRLSRTQAHFKIKPQISFQDDTEGKYCSLFLITSDRPGLLASISRVFFKQKILLHNAKIATAGERVEDMFYISNGNGENLSPLEKNELKQALISELIKH